jgi:DNA-binding transcriptional regulator/RsmH inhibitor MraZ
LCSSTPCNIDSQGRIRITKACLDHTGLGPGERVTMLGVGLWYEVSTLSVC